MRYLVTGGTGTLGQELTKQILKKHPYNEVVVYSRDEYKQSEMAKHVISSRVKFWIGDVRDLERLKHAMDGVDIIIHTAAMKRMDTISNNVSELAEINITGTKNVTMAGANCYKVIFVSSDKAYLPTCAYGATKMIAEKIVLARPNGYVWRFGNFINSRGSVWKVFKEQAKSGVLTVTHADSTRFIIHTKRVCDHLLSDVEPGLHYPKDLKSIKIIDLAREIAPDAEIKIIGLREGEKIDESFDENYTSKKIYEKQKKVK